MQFTVIPPNHRQTRLYDESKHRNLFPRAIGLKTMRLFCCAINLRCKLPIESDTILYMCRLEDVV